MVIPASKPARVQRSPGQQGRVRQNVHASDELSDADYSALVEALIDEEDDVEAEFSMLKCSMIEAGTYFEPAARMHIFSGGTLPGVQGGFMVSDLQNAFDESICNAVDDWGALEMGLAPRPYGERMMAPVSSGEDLRSGGHPTTQKTTIFVYMCG